MIVGEEFPEITITPEEIAALRASGPWWEWRLHTDKELEEILRKEKMETLEKEAREKREKEEKEKMEFQLAELRTKSRLQGPIGVNLPGLLQEFDRQVKVLIQKGVPQLLEISEEKFTFMLQPLKVCLPALSKVKLPEGHIPFVIVLREKLLSLEKEIPLMKVDGKKGFTTLNLSELKTAEGVEIPESMAYLIIDVENGKAMLGKSPDEAEKQLKKEGRFPLTAEEGVAFILQHPEILKDHYMDLPASRRGGDWVVCLWLDMGEPKLVWNWADCSDARWGSASCGSRVR